VRRETTPQELGVLLRGIDFEQANRQKGYRPPKVHKTGHFTSFFVLQPIHCHLRV
jgi:hypothetical protein